MRNAGPASLLDGGSRGIGFLKASPLGASPPVSLEFTAELQIWLHHAESQPIQRRPFSSKVRPIHPWSRRSTLRRLPYLPARIRHLTPLVCLATRFSYPNVGLRRKTARDEKSTWSCDTDTMPQSSIGDSMDTRARADPARSSRWYVLPARFNHLIDHHMLICLNPSSRLTSPGGCLSPCGFKLDCGHVCSSCCHADSHAAVRCRRNCSKLLPACGHPCLNICSDECGPCKIPISNVKLPCGHVVPSVPW